MIKDIPLRSENGSEVKTAKQKMDNPQVDYAVEREKNRKSIFNWKIISLVLAVLLAAAIAGRSTLDSKGYIASIVVDEVIFEDQAREKKLGEIAENDKIKAVILHVNSPGGTVVGAEKTYNLLREISKTKPVVAVMGSMATSGAYMISLGADHIICHHGTVTGSIGVIMESMEITELAKNLGIKFTNFKSSKFKAAPNYTEQVTPEVREYIMDNLIGDAAQYFKTLVVDRRKLSKAQADNVATGKIYMGKKALELGLVDKVGGSGDALLWLKEEKKLGENLQIVDISLKEDKKLIDVILDDMKTSMSQALIRVKNVMMAI